MNYNTTVDYLYSLLPAYQKIGQAAFKKDLTNIKKLCTYLGNPQDKFKSIHIAGTNGKGSCTHILAAVLIKAGYKTGIYSSPHLVDFRERIKIDGQLVHKNSVIQFVKRIQPILEEVKPSFFELTVAMAFDYFNRQKVDIAIIETGLGGRLDSTNIIRPILSVITNIGLEHQDILGDTLPLIAGEKAGIIKPNTPVVIGEYNSATAKVFKATAKQHKAEIFFASKQFKTHKVSVNKNTVKHTITRTYDKIKLNIACDLSGNYQAKNLVTIYQALSVLRNKKLLKISQKAILSGCKNVVNITNFFGRWQQIKKNPRTIIDCAHNAAGIKSIVTQLKTENAAIIYIVFGCVSDKDLQEITKLMPKKATYFITEPKIQRAKPFLETAKAFKKAKHNVVFTSKNSQTCYQEALKMAKKNDLILITGSVFLIAEFI